MQTGYFGAKGYIFPQFCIVCYLPPSTAHSRHPTYFQMGQIREDVQQNLVRQFVDRLKTMIKKISCVQFHSNEKSRWPLRVRYLLIVVFFKMVCSILQCQRDRRAKRARKHERKLIIEIENTVSANGLRLTPSVKYTVDASNANCPQISVSIANRHDFQHNFSSKITRKTSIFTSRFYDRSTATVSNSKVRVKNEEKKKRSIGNSFFVRSIFV